MFPANALRWLEVQADIPSRIRTAAYLSGFDDTVDRLFQPERLGLTLSSPSLRRAAKADAVNSRIIALQSEVTEANDKLKRLYRLIEDGLTEMNGVLKDRLDSLKSDRERAKAAPEWAKAQSPQPIK